MKGRKERRIYRLSVVLLLLIFFMGLGVDGQDLQFGNGKAYALALAPDGNTLVIGTSSGLETWDISTQSLIERRDLGVVYDIVFFSDGAAVALATRDRIEIRSYPEFDLTAEVHYLTPSAFGQFPCIALSPDNMMIAVLSAVQDRILIWETTDYFLVQEILVSKAETIAFVANDQIVVGLFRGGFEIWDVPSGESASVLIAAEAGEGLFVSPLEGKVWYSQSSGTISVFDTLTLSSDSFLTGLPSREFFWFGGSQSDQRILSFGRSWELEIWDSSDPTQVVASHTLYDYILDSVFAANGSKCVLLVRDALSRNLSIVAIDLINPQTDLLRFGDWDSGYSGFSISSDRQLLLRKLDGSIELWDVKTGELLKAIVVRDPQLAVMTTDGRWIVYYSYEDPHFVAWDWQNDRSKTILRVPERPGYSRLSPDNTLMAIGHYDGTLSVVSIPEFALLYSLPSLYETSTTWIEFSPDSSILAVSTYNAPIDLRDANSGEPIAQVISPNGKWRCNPVFTSDGSLFAGSNQGIHRYTLDPISREITDEAFYDIAYADALIAFPHSPHLAVLGNAGSAWDDRLVEIFRIDDMKIVMTLEIPSHDVMNFYKVYDYDIQILQDPNSLLIGRSDGLVTISEFNMIPTAMFSHGPYLPRSEFAVDFASTSTDRESDPMTFYWDFGDGNAATGDTVTHVFEDPGTYLVSLRATDHLNRTATTQKEILVLANEETIVRIRPPATPIRILDRVQFPNDSSFPSHVDPVWEWTFGDGGGVSSLLGVHTYLIPGTYNVSLRLFSASQEIAADSISVSVVALSSIDSVETEDDRSICAIKLHAEDSDTQLGRSFEVIRLIDTSFGSFVLTVGKGTVVTLEGEYCAGMISQVFAKTPELGDLVRFTN